jgi:hypothetical protein
MKLPCLGPVEIVSLKEGSPSLMDPNVVIGSKACTFNTEKRKTNWEGWNGGYPSFIVANSE